MKILSLALGAACALVLSAGASLADMKVALQGGWDGNTVPAGQHCGLHGGKGMSPPMNVSGLPRLSSIVT